MKKEDFYRYVFLDDPICGMDIHFFDDSIIRGFFEEENQTEELKKKNLWRYYPETCWPSNVAIRNALAELKTKNFNENDAEIKALKLKQLRFLELLNGEQVKGLKAFKMTPVLFNNKK